MSVTNPFSILETNLSGKPMSSWGFWSDANTTAFELFRK